MIGASLPWSALNQNDAGSMHRLLAKKKTDPLSEVGVGKEGAEEQERDGWGVRINAAGPDRIGRDSVAIMLQLVRPLHRHVDVGGLLGAELGELGADLVEVETGHQFV